MLVEMQFWLVDFWPSLAKMACGNLRQFCKKKPQIEVDSERTELTSKKKASPRTEIIAKPSFD